MTSMTMRDRQLSRPVPGCITSSVFAAIVVLMLQAPALAQQIALRHFDIADGLGSLSVGAMMLDREGFIWAGTESGVFRYNGRSFERQGIGSPLANATIRAIGQQQGGAGTIFISTPAEIYARIGQTFAPVRAGGQKLGVMAGDAFAATPDGDMLAVAESRLWRLSAAGGTWRATQAPPAGLPQAAQITGVHLAPGGTLWLVCDHHLCRVSPHGTEVWDERKGVPEDDWLSFLSDSQGRLWVRGPDHLIRLDPGQTRFREQDPPHVSFTASFHYAPLAEDEQHRILTRTNDGLARFDGQGWTEFTSANGLSRLAVRHLLTDRQGAIWMSNSGRGVSRWLGYDKIESWTAAQGLAAEPVWEMARQGARLLIGTSGGCSALEAGSSLITPCAITGLPADEPREMMSAPSGDVWMNYRHAVIHLPPHSRAATAIPGLDGADDLYADPFGLVWCAYPGHLLVIPANGGAAPAARHIAFPAPSMRATALTMDTSGRLWVAFDAALYTWADDVWTRQTYPAAPGIVLQDIAMDGPVLWAAGYPHGVLRAAVAQGRVTAAAWVDSPLVNEAAVMFARVDRAHRVWVGTEQGIAVFDGGRWQRLSQPDGLVWNDVDDGAFLADADGTAWIGTGNGLSHIRNVAALLADQKLDLRIQSLAVGGHDLARPARPGDTIAEQSLPWSSDRALTAAFAVLNFDRSPTTHFRIRVLGTGEDWFDSQDDRLHYGSLAAGAYDLQVAAVDQEHNTLSAVLDVPFNIAAPWWRSPVVLAAELAAAGAIMVAGVRVWVARITAQRAEAERQLAEHRLLLHNATHDSLTGLVNRGTIMARLAEQMDRATASGYPLAVAMIDIDHFKHINDTYGHLTGDKVLRALADLIPTQLRASDLLGRYGGEEMLVIMPGLISSSPVAVLERLRLLIASHTVMHEGVALSVTASFGVTWFRSSSDTLDALVGRADAALYAAKHAGRDRISYVIPRAA